MTFHIGQVIPAGQDWDRRAIFEDGPARWHALCVPVMKEDQAEAWLKIRGVYAFHPIKRKQTKLRGKVIERKKRYLPGYVFARFPGRAIPNRVLECPFITDAIRLPNTEVRPGILHPGEWAILSPHDLRGIHAMRAQEDAQHRARENARRIRRGDRVRVLGGLMGEDGQEVEVLELKANGRVKFRIRMFGADVPAEATLDRVTKIGVDA